MSSPFEQTRSTGWLNHPRFAISVDVEDYFQVWAFSDCITRQSWDEFPLRVGETTRRCLDMFDEAGTKATFFTLGWVGERDKALIRDIVSRGHELASHGYDHAKVNTLTSDAFYEDVRKTKMLLEDIGGVEVRGFRAAGFSIDNTTPWAYERLEDAGYHYSSSSHPIAHDHYGDDSAPQTPHKPDENGNIVEAPVATQTLLGRRVSCAGGGWFRAIPYTFSKSLINRAASDLDGPVIFYFHPWEIDVDQPRMKQASAKSRLRHYLNLRGMQPKLEKLLDEFQWGRVDDVLGLEKVT